MGLDAVEVILEIEDTFKISIPDADAEKCKTIRDLIDTVAVRVDPRQGAGSQVCLPPSGAIADDADFAVEVG